jgi:hypothetical protein
MRTSELQHEPISALEDLGVEFGVSADGFPVARIGDTHLAMVPARDGASFLAKISTVTMAASRMRRLFAPGSSRRPSTSASYPP